MTSIKAPTKHVFLWATLRSLSSAFEHSIMNLPKTKMMSEPFATAYYFGPQRQDGRFKSQEIEPDASYENTAKATMAQPTDGDIELVFVKDMAYYMKGKLDMLKESPLNAATHSFLIRDPNKSIRSLHRAMQNPAIQALGFDYFDPGDTGFRELHELYEFVKQNLDPNPVVIDADDLVDSPNHVMKAYCDGVGIRYAHHMTSWKAGEVPELWRDRWGLAWRQGAINSSGFHKNASNKVPDEKFPADVMKIIDESQPFYKKLYAARIRIA